MCDTDQRLHWLVASITSLLRTSFGSFPWIQIIVLSRFPQFVISWLPQKSRGVIRDQSGFERRGQKKHFPFLVITSLWLLYILLITLTIAYLISFTLPLQSSSGGKVKIPSPNTLLYFFFRSSSSVQASRQPSAFFLIFLEPARSGLHNFFSPQEALESILFNHLCMSIGIPELFRLDGFVVVCLFSFLFYHCFFLASRLIENDEWELDGRP